MAGLVEAVVGRPAVVDHGAGVIEPQDVRSHIAAACRVDDVGRGLRADQRMQPGGVAAHARTGLVGHDPSGLGNGLADRLVDRLQRAAARSTVWTLPPRLRECRRGGPGTG